MSDSVLGQEMIPTLMGWGSFCLNEESEVQAMIFSQAKLRKQESLLLSTHWTVDPSKLFSFTGHKGNRDQGGEIISRSIKQSALHWFDHLCNEKKRGYRDSYFVWALNCHFMHQQQFRELKFKCDCTVRFQQV